MQQKRLALLACEAKCKNKMMNPCHVRHEEESLKPIFHCDAKPFALGPGIGLDTQRLNFALPIPTCWYLKMLKFALPPTPTVKFALSPMRNPNASQWNIGCVGSPTQHFCFGHVDFMLFIPGFFHVGYPTQTLFSVEYGLKVSPKYQTIFRSGT